MNALSCCSGTRRQHPRHTRHAPSGSASKASQGEAGSTFWGGHWGGHGRADRRHRCQRWVQVTRDPPSRALWEAHSLPHSPQIHVATYSSRCVLPALGRESEPLTDLAQPLPPRTGLLCPTQKPLVLLTQRLPCPRRRSDSTTLPGGAGLGASTVNREEPLNLPEFPLQTHTHCPLPETLLTFFPPSNL